MSASSKFFNVAPLAALWPPPPYLTAILLMLYLLDLISAITLPSISSVKLTHILIPLIPAIVLTIFLEIENISTLYSFISSFITSAIPGIAQLDIPENLNEIIDSEGKVCYWDKTRNNVYDIKKAKYKTFAEFLQRVRKLEFSSDAFGTYPTLYTGNYIPNGYLIRKSIFEKIGFFTSEAPLEDYWLMLQISKYAKIKYLDEILFSYRWHNANTIKNIEKIRLYTDKTSELEEKILSKVNENEVLPNVITVKKQGVCYKAQGIPFLFQTLTYKKSGCKRKIIKLFNIKVFEYQK